MSRARRHGEALVRAHGLTPEEYDRAVALLGREPNLAELGVIGAMWSEHCSYKSSAAHLERLRWPDERVLHGFGANAGVVALDDTWALAFKIESHNHPSFIEPVQGAATGVGGILRDVIAMGARPIALMNSLRFGRLELERRRALMRGVVQGISGYGNAVGVPTVGGEWDNDRCYDENILVNVFALGVVRRDEVQRAAPHRVGDQVLYFGARTGRDGMHGATMASAQLDDDRAARRPAVQVGDPFLASSLIEATLELVGRKLVSAVQDMGAAGLTCASVEMASQGGVGVRLDCDQVPEREPQMSAREHLLSESQERMLAVVTPGREREALQVIARWGLCGALIGEVIKARRFEVWQAGEVAASLPIALLVDQAPRLERAITPPRERRGEAGGQAALCRDERSIKELALLVLGEPAIASKRACYEQFDAHVGLATLAAFEQAAAAVMRVMPARRRIALSIDGASRQAYLDPQRGAERAVAEAARHVSCVGATPWAITNGLNLGDPNDGEVMWELKGMVEGMRRACLELKLPIVSGNVSLYNASHGRHIAPTPIIGALGVFEHEARHVGITTARDGDELYLVGDLRAGSLEGSALAGAVSGMRGEEVEAIAFEVERALQRALRRGAAAGLLHAAQDCSEGGLFVATVEMSSEALGVELELAEMERDEALMRLFHESPSRVVVAVAASRQRDAWLKLCAELGVSAEPIGRVSAAAQGGWRWAAMGLEFDAETLRRARHIELLGGLAAP